MQIESTFTMCFVLSGKPINVSMIVRLLIFRTNQFFPNKSDKFQITLLLSSILIFLNQSEPLRHHITKSNITYKMHFRITFYAPFNGPIPLHPPWLPGEMVNVEQLRNFLHSIRFYTPESIQHSEINVTQICDRTQIP